jgi:diphthine synthase
MISTTHADLRIRAKERGIETKIIHGSSIVSAVCGLSGLQNYRFGKSCSLPYPAKNCFPRTPLTTILSNMRQNLHTLVYLDIQPDRYMSVHEGIDILERLMGGHTGFYYLVRRNCSCRFFIAGCRSWFCIPIEDN